MHSRIMVEVSLSPKNKEMNKFSLKAYLLISISYFCYKIQIRFFFFFKKKSRRTSSNWIMQSLLQQKATILDPNLRPNWRIKGKTNTQIHKTLLKTKITHWAFQLLTDEILESMSLAVRRTLLAAWRAIERSDKQDPEDEDEDELEEEEPTTKWALKSLISSSKWARSETLRAKSVQSLLKAPENPEPEIRTTSWTARRAVSMDSPATATALVSPPAIVVGRWCCEVGSVFTTTMSWLAYGAHEPWDYRVWELFFFF